MNFRHTLKPLYILCFLSAGAQAVTVDLRHEYLDDSKFNGDRVLVWHRFDSGLGFSVEGKVKSTGDNADLPFHDLVSDGSEYSLDYAFNVAPGVTVIPGMVYEATSDKSIYKPQVYAKYDFSNGFYVAGRYRYEYIRDTRYGEDDEHVNKEDLWIGYQGDVWLFEGNVTYFNSDHPRYDGGENDYELDMKVGYSINKNWRPYAQLGNVSVRNNADDRQTRYRMGVEYTF